MTIPYIPKVQPQPEVESEPQDLRVRTTRDEVLAGLDQQGKLYLICGSDYAIGPGNLRYSLQTLLELEFDGLVQAQDADGKTHTFSGFAAYIERLKDEGGSGADDEGTEGNDLPERLTWVRV